MKDDDDRVIFNDRANESADNLHFVFRSAAEEFFRLEVNDASLDFKVNKSTRRSRAPQGRSSLLEMDISARPPSCSTAKRHFASLTLSATFRTSLNN